MTWKRACTVLGVLIAMLVALGQLSAQAAIWWAENASRIVATATAALSAT